MDNQDKIAQFKNMTEADPENELGHFSLAKAYHDAEQYADAEPSFLRVLEINPEFSKAYHLLAETRIKLDKRDDAIATLTKGYEVSAKRGDRIPRDAMGELLSKLGQPIPEVELPSDNASIDGAGAAPGSTGDFQCSRCGRPSGKLPDRPFKGDLGERIWANICSVCWSEWVGMGTKVINELGLQLANPQHQKAFDDQMKEFLQLED